jgi:hypothetical protein
MRRALSAIVDGAPSEAERARLGEALVRLTARDVEVVALPAAASPGAARNAALRASRGELVAFLDGDERCASTFLEPACRLLERRPRAGFVTSWLDGVPAQGDRPARPCGAGELLGRPWLLHVPTVLARAALDAVGGFDEALPAGEELDACLRILESGGEGAAIEAPGLRARPFGGALDGKSLASDEARRAARALFDKHAAVVLRHLDAALLGKERTLRDLSVEATRLDGRRVELERRLGELDADLARIARARGER